jgi:hypothetical protein
LDFLSVPDEAIKLRTAQYLADIYKGESFDVIVALYAAGLRFAINYRELFAPKVPIVFCCPPSVGLSDLVLPNDVIGILGELHADKTRRYIRPSRDGSRQCSSHASAPPRCYRHG